MRRACWFCFDVSISWFRCCSFFCLLLESSLQYDELLHLDSFFFQYCKYAPMYYVPILCGFALSFPFQFSFHFFLVWMIVTVAWMSQKQVLILLIFFFMFQQLNPIYILLKKYRWIWILFYFFRWSVSWIFFSIIWTLFEWTVVMIYGIFLALPCLNVLYLMNEMIILEVNTVSLKVLTPKSTKKSTKWQLSISNPLSLHVLVKYKCHFHC